MRYTDREHARNEYPYRIISPSRSGPCCLGPMEVIGEVHADGSALFQYQRCPHCGFTVRRVLEQLPDAALVAELRLLLERSFMRNVAPELWAA